MDISVSSGLAVISRHPRYLLDHMGMGAQNQIRAVFCKKGRPVSLGLGGFQHIFRPPVRTDDHKVRQLLRRLQIRRHPLLLQQVNGIGHALRQRNSVGSVGIVQNGDFDFILLVYIDLLLRFPTVMNAQNGNVRVVFPPERQTVQNPFPPLVQSVIGGVQHHVEPRLRQRVPKLIRSIESGIPRDSKFFAADDDLLIH